MSVQETIVNWLFATQAIRVSPADQPFWYTSGTLGPYYINTHFLYGSEKEANELLALIESATADPLSLPQKLADAINRQYLGNTLYHDLLDLIASWLRAGSFDFISGGERRDFFFSIQAAALLGKPHLSLLKNGTAIWTDPGFINPRIVGADELHGLSAAHVADLVTEASSYQRAWLPAIHRCGASMPLTLAVVDRDQGGREWLSAAGTELLALTRIDLALFEQALSAGLIHKSQFDQIRYFMDSPMDYMRHFLSGHPDFLSQQISGGGKNRERALLCQEKGYADGI